MDLPEFSDLDLSEKEQKILQAATTVFSEKGFSAATTGEIAKNAGVAEGTIFRYFKTKKDILRGILIQTINIISGKLVMGSVEKILLGDDDKDFKTALKELLYDRMKLVDSIFPMARVVFTEAMFHEDVREAVYNNIIERALGIFRLFHKRMMGKGMMRDDVEPEVLFRSILGNMAVLIAQKKLFADKFKIDDMDKEFDKMVDVIMYGISVNRPGEDAKQQGKE